MIRPSRRVERSVNKASMRGRIGGWLDLDMMLVYSLPMSTNLVGKMVNRPGGMLT